MPAHQRSHRLTSLYRERLRAISQRVEGAARAAWPDISELDATDWADRMARVLTAAQTESVRATGGYLTAFVASETGVRPSVIQIDPRKYAGVTRDGRALAEALQSPLIGVRVKLKDGVMFPEALDYGLQRALRMVGFEVMQSGREALIDTVTADERFSDFQRAVAGTCGACEALSGTGGPRFEVHPNCFPAGTEVLGPPVRAATKRRFDGEVVEVRYVGGDVLTCTPNHPVLTPLGWVPAAELGEGSDVVRGEDGQRGAALMDPNYAGAPALIEQVGEALEAARGMAPVTVPMAPEDFHGDGAHGDVDVVRADRLRQGDPMATLAEHVGEVALCLGCVGLLALAGVSPLDSLRHGGFATASGAVGGLGLLSARSRAFPGVADPLGLRVAADVDFPLDESLANAGPADPEPLGDGLLRFASLIGRDDFGCVQVESVRRRPFSGHVFNLQTVDGWYTANRIVVHNCECVPQPVIKGLRDRFPVPTGAALFSAKSPAEQDAAVGPDAAALIRDGKADLKDFVAHSPQELGPDYVTQKPAAEVG